MTKLHKQRLAKLAAFLRELPSKKFDFQWVVREFDPKTNCGTVCCAVGWTPKVFPKLVKWADSSIKTREGRYGFIATTELLFGLTGEEAERLFVGKSRFSRYAVLPPNSTPKQVAKGIEQFLDEIQDR